MINRIKEKLFKRAESAKLLKDVCHRLAGHRKKAPVLALYGSPTAGNWLGVANVTTTLFPDAAFEMPQYYSNSIFTGAQIKVICQKIKELKFEKVIISGFALYFYEYIDLLYTSCRIEILFQGTISEFNNPVTQKFIKSLIEYSREKKIHHLYFLKSGLEKVFVQLYGFEASHLPLGPAVIPPNITLIKTDPSKINIGVFGWDTFNKNLHNQLIYALMNPNTVVHVLDKGIFEYLGLGDRIIGYGGNLAKEKFLGILGAMDVNLYMSYNESWGLVAFESEAMGVPAVRMDDIDYYEKIRKAIESRKSK
ncbi:MAG: hypothetical protein JWO03_3267 [Bacteroidetes bacterium]|nr:hypothetical protein [Bacteroidota bacterium]